jgi:aspartate aminotransferase
MNVFQPSGTASRPRISPRMAFVTTSKIYEAIARVADMQAAGIKVASLTAGEPDFDTPEHVIAAATRAMLDGDTHYSPVRGSLALREAVRQKFHQENGLEFSDDQTIVGTGSKQVIFNALAVTLQQGDEVLLPVPFWAAYTGMTYAAGGVPAFVQTSRNAGYKLRPEDLSAAITTRTRWLILNTPSNPAGVIYSESELEGLGRVLRNFPDVFILSDEIYEHLHYTAERPKSLLSVCPDLANRVLTVNGVSKAYAMTGWRLGFGAGPKDLIEAMANLQAQTTLGPSSVSQAAAVAALSGPRTSIDYMVDAYRQRRDLIVDMVDSHPLVKLQRPDGAFYALLDIAAALRGSKQFGDHEAPDAAFCEWLLKDRHVAAVPGSVFGAPGTVRISFATDSATIEHGLGTMLRAVSEIE